MNTSALAVRRAVELVSPSAYYDLQIQAFRSSLRGQITVVKLSVQEFVRWRYLGAVGI